VEFSYKTHLGFSFQNVASCSILTHRSLLGPTFTVKVDISMPGINDIADTVAIRNDKFINRYSFNSSDVCEICSLIVK